MGRINDKGFTLVELIATLVILALVMGIGAVSITKVIENSKKKDYELLITEINNAVELYYQECKYSQNGVIDCPSIDYSGYYNITLGDLVSKGFLKGNATIKTEDEKDPNNNKLTLVNPNNNNNISDCRIKYRYDSGKIEVKTSGQNSTSSCPTEY